MQPIYAYLLKLSFCLALGYLFYYILLRRLTYYQWNRYFLLFFPLFALFVPMLPFYQVGNLSTIDTVFYLTNAIPSKSITSGAAGLTQVSSWNLFDSLVLFFISGVIFFFLRFMIRVVSLKRTTGRAELLYEAGGVKLFQLTGVKAPFSFNNSIYIDTSLYSETELQDIVAHEMVHVAQKHSFDVLVSEVLCIAQWFNPFVWVHKQAVKQNLEFIADETVLKAGTDRKNYQYLLLKVSGAMQHSIANNLVFPSLKKRIHMMNRKRSARVHLIRFIYVVPLSCLLLLAFSGPAVNPKGPRIIGDPELFSLGNLSFYINDANIAAIVKKEQDKSLLKAGGRLSLSLISEEKTRLTRLLQKNGYDNLSSNSITFVMDTSAATKSFSIQVTIQLEKNKRGISPAANSAINQADVPVTETYPRYAIRVDEERPEPLPAEPKPIPDPGLRLGMK